MKHFFVRLIPPRPTFPQDMSAGERLLMQEHSVYLKSLQEQGIVPVYGPVMDPKGAWGMAVFETESVEQARSYLNNDPTVKSHLNAYEIVPMNAVMRKDGNQ